MVNFPFRKRSPPVASDLVFLEKYESCWSFAQSCPKFRYSPMSTVSENRAIREVRIPTGVLSNTPCWMFSFQADTKSFMRWRLGLNSGSVGSLLGHLSWCLTRVSPVRPHRKWLKLIYFSWGCCNKSVTIMTPVECNPMFQWNLGTALISIQQSDSYPIEDRKAMVHHSLSWSLVWTGATSIRLSVLFQWLNIHAQV